MLGKTQAEAKDKLKAAMAECQGVEVSKAADEYTVATWLRTWYELYAKPNVRTATANRYELIIERYTIPRIGSIKLKKLTTRHLQKLYKELLEDGRIHVGKEQTQGLSTTTVRSVHLMLHAALKRAVKERLISTRTVLPQSHGNCKCRSSHRKPCTPTWKLPKPESCSPCSIWNWSAACGRANY